jgi:hypothetical protein
LVACYLYPKNFLEGNEDTTPKGPIAQGLEFKEWLAIVSANLEDYYGQFVTRMLMDHASFISPYNRFPKHSRIYTNFFKKIPDAESRKLVESAFHFETDEYDGGHVIVDAGQYPILWTFAALDKKTNAKDLNYPQWVNHDPKFAAFAEIFLSQLRAERMFFAS